MSEYVIDLSDTEVRRVGSLYGVNAIAAFCGLPVHEEIVRCRDCKHYTDHEWVLVTDVSDVCHFWHGEPTKVEPNGFCAWGERKVSA